MVESLNLHSDQKLFQSSIFTYCTRIAHWRAALCNSLFKWSLILQPKLILQPNLRYVNEMSLCERNLDFATEINHFATKFIEKIIWSL